MIFQSHLFILRMFNYRRDFFASLFLFININRNFLCSRNHPEGNNNARIQICSIVHTFDTLDILHTFDFHTQTFELFVWWQRECMTYWSSLLLGMSRSVSVWNREVGLSNVIVYSRRLLLSLDSPPASTIHPSPSLSPLTNIFSCHMISVPTSLRDWRPGVHLRPLTRLLWGCSEGCSQCGHSRRRSLLTLLLMFGVEILGPISYLEQIQILTQQHLLHYITD